MSKEISILNKLKNYARKLKQNLYVLYLAYKDPRVPWFAKLFTICVVAYAFSPIDLIPDFIPVLGYLDDLIIVPWGIVLALKMIPQPVLVECRLRSGEVQKKGKPTNWITGILIIIIWIVCAAWIGLTFYSMFK